MSTSDKKRSTVAPTADAVTMIQSAEGSLPSGAPLDKATREEKRSLARRSTPAQINLVLAEAEASGGVVGGVALDVTALRQAQATSTRYRVGAAAAKRILQRLDDDAVTIDAAIAQRVSAAVAALEGQSKSPDGAALVSKVATLRAAARKRRKARAPKSAPVAPTAPIATSPASVPQH